MSQVFSQQVMGCGNSLPFCANHAHTLSHQPRKQEKARGACLPGIQDDAPARKHGAIQRKGFILAAFSTHVAAILPAVPSVLAEERGKRVHCPAALPSVPLACTGAAVMLICRVLWLDGAILAGAH